jgi:hypothetical protein
MKYDMGAAYGMYGESRGTYRNGGGNLRERVHFEDIGIDGRIILKLISKKSVGSSWIGFMWPRIGTSGGLLRGIS